MLDEQAELGSESLVQQLNELFENGEQNDLGESADVQDVAKAKTAATQAPPLPPLKPQAFRKRISFQFKKDETNSDLGESHKVSTNGRQDRARRMIQLGDMLQSMASTDGSRNSAVAALNQALHAKLLMDELHPQTGSYAKTQHPQDELGEDHSDDQAPLESFQSLIHEHKKNMAQITEYLLERKKLGRPLTTKEDGELQKFYYNRASTILKKIVLLKQGQQPPKENDQHRSDQMEGRDSAEDDLAQDASDAEVEKLRFDAKVANANAAFNNKMLATKKARMAAALKSREKAYSESLKAKQQQSKYDAKVADAETKYNKALSDELLKEKHLAELKVRGAAEQKQQADIAAEKATEEAEAADKEAAEAEKEAEAAEHRALELEKQAQADGKTVPSKEDNEEKKAIPLSVVPHSDSKSLLRYLQTTIDNHLKISMQEKQLMQGWFLKAGSALLSQLAQVDPDATWHSKGVMREEQFEMDKKRPDQLSQEWGSKHLQGSTIMKDFMGDILSHHTSETELQRPQGMEAVNIFGNPQKVPLKFAQDDSHPMLTEPAMQSDLGESGDDLEQTPHQGAMSAMMGIMDEASE